MFSEGYLSGTCSSRQSLSLSFIFSKVVGSQARILYSNEEGRIALATAFNKAVADGRLKVGLQSCDSHMPLWWYMVLYSCIHRAQSC